MMTYHNIDDAYPNEKELKNWAYNKPPKNEKQKSKTIKKQNKECKNNEKKWGNRMIGQKNNGQWTTKLGENLVLEELKKLGQNPRKPKKKNKNNFQPDFETDEYIVEVKTRSWWVDGTAGEKVLGTWIKYQDIPDIYGKPLLIVCVANQEYELTHGKINYFGENISEKTKDILNLAKSWDIEYIPFSKLDKRINFKK